MEFIPFFGRVILLNNHYLRADIEALESMLYVIKSTNYGNTSVQVSASV